MVKKTKPNINIELIKENTASELFKNNEKLKKKIKLFELEKQKFIDQSSIDREIIRGLLKEIYELKQQLTKG